MGLFLGGTIDEDLIIRDVAPSVPITPLIKVDLGTHGRRTRGQQGAEERTLWWESGGPGLLLS